MDTLENNKSQDEYSYTQRKEFTSEIYKIEVRNLGIFGISEFKKLLRKQFSLDASKIKSPKRRDFAYVCFRSQADQEKAIAELDGYKWKGKILKVTSAKAIPDPLVKRRHEQKANEQNDDSQKPKKPKTSLEATCPLASIPYEEQLKQKEDEVKSTLKSLRKGILKVNPSVKTHLVQTEDDTSVQDNDELLACKFLGIKAAPKIEDYRNKSEFAIGKNSNGEIIVGFRLGSYVDGSVEVGPIDDLPHIPENVKTAAKVFEQFVRQSSEKYQVFNPEHNSGHFKQLGIRSSEVHENEIMIIVGIYSENLKEEEISQLKKDIKEFFENYDKNVFQFTSLYYQDMKRRVSGQMCNPVEHLSGKTHIYDEIYNLKFRISPLAFFQINTLSAELLYKEAIQLANIQPHSTVLDICCGTGTIGLCFAKHCKQVIGVDIIEDAIKDAQFNAENNQIKNAKFYAGNADNYIYSMIKEAMYGYSNDEKQDLIAVVDPPRAGLHNKSILAIRNASELNRLIYIACNPKNALRNWIDLARPESKTYKGYPFLPKIAVAVDMFPHTTHTELIILFERKQENQELNKQKNPVNKSDVNEANSNNDQVDSIVEVKNVDNNQKDNIL